MKSKRKAMLLVLCAVLLVAASVLGTMAYLTARDTVTNTFTVGQVKIKLDEAALKADGRTADETKPRVQGNEYHLLPGGAYYKDPTVTVLKGSEECYVRMLVTINNKAKLDEIFDPGATLGTIFTGYNTDWGTPIVTTNEDTRIYEFRYKTTLAAPSADVPLPALFKGITVPGTITNEDLADLEDFKIIVVAQAIQADGFDDADEAWEAFG